MSDALPCARCGKAVEVNAGNYELFEKMHWLCFHLEFEHGGDPDKACEDPACPWWRMEVYCRELERLGAKPAEVLRDAVAKRWAAGS